MRRKLNIVFALACLLATSSFAQRQMFTPEQRTQQLKDSLSLTEEQTASVLKIFQEMDVERKALFESSGDDRDAMRQAMRGLAEKSDTKIDSLLTNDQKEKYAEMKKRRQERGMGRRRDN